MYVIALIDFSVFEKDKRYDIVNADAYEYQVEHKKGHYTWIGKDDTVHFEYHV